MSAGFLSDVLWLLCLSAAFNLAELSPTQARIHNSCDQQLITIYKHTLYARVYRLQQPVNELRKGAGLSLAMLHASVKLYAFLLQATPTTMLPFVSWLAQ